MGGWLVILLSLISSLTSPLNASVTVIAHHQVQVNITTDESVTEVWIHKTTAAGEYVNIGILPVEPGTHTFTIPSNTEPNSADMFHNYGDRYTFQFYHRSDTGVVTLVWTQELTVMYQAILPIVTAP